MPSFGAEDLAEIRLYVELTAVAVGSVSGALHAQRRGLDVIGVEVIGVVSGLGGGLVRDVMLGQPALALRTPAVLVTALAAALVGALFASAVAHLRKPAWVVDTLALGLFAVAGLQRAEAAGLSIVPSLFLGVVTTVGGGLVRDVLCREVPLVLLPGQPYAVTALFAGAVYLVALRGAGVAPLTAEVLAVATAFAVRSLSAWRGWSVPTLPDLARTVRRRLGRQSRERAPPDERP